MNQLRNGRVLLNDLIFIEPQKLSLASLTQLLAQVVLSHVEQVKKMHLAVLELFPVDDDLPEFDIAQEHFDHYASLSFIFAWSGEIDVLLFVLLR
jgi:hypothetical protein